VDDEPQVRFLVASALEDEGFFVVTAGNGQDALALSELCQRRVDLLVTDIAMPGMDGATLARELLARAPDLPVILMSGTYNGADITGVGSARFLAKPFSLANLVGLVRAVSAPKVGAAHPS
jgi:two-component system cell cycle sensor histidine kinase/response regulator CckA